jgi:hypothetical protein
MFRQFLAVCSIPINKINEKPHLEEEGGGEEKENGKERKEGRTRKGKGEEGSEVRGESE